MRLIILAYLLFASFGCQKPTPLTVTPQSDGKKTYEQFAATIKSYPYEARQERKDKIIKNYQNLEIGMSKDRIAELIGDPDYSGLDYTKGPKEKWLGSNWTYWLRKRDDGVNVYDPCLEIFFGTDDRAKWIVPSNIDGLKEKGNPSHRP